MTAAFQLAIESGAEGADDAAALAEQVEGLGQQLADAGLAIGARDADQVQGAARLAIEAASDGRQLAGQALDGNQFSAGGNSLGAGEGMAA